MRAGGAAGVARSVTRSPSTTTDVQGARGGRQRSWSPFQRSTLTVRWLPDGLSSGYLRTDGVLDLVHMSSHSDIYTRVAAEPTEVHDFSLFGGIVLGFGWYRHGFSTVPF